MPKYFYTDPLKAAWMGQEFGFNFYQLCEARNNPKIGNNLLRYEVSNREIKYYIIQLDSHNLLKPQVGDVFLDVRDAKPPFAAHVCDGLLNVKDEGLKISYNDINSGGFVPVAYVEIIQRNGKAFFAPEIEE